jgi:hypothetical protein
LYYQGLANNIPATEIVDEMLPVAPRRTMQQKNKSKFTDNLNTKQVDKGPLFIITKNRISEVKTVVNSRIVVVGGTSYSHAVLETFCFIPNLIFTNIYVVYDRPSSLGGGAMSYKNNGDQMFGNNYSGCLSVRDVDDPSQQDLYSLGKYMYMSMIPHHLYMYSKDCHEIVPLFIININIYVCFIKIEI